MKIAVCSCGASFYEMNEFLWHYSNERKSPVHKWVFVKEPLVTEALKEVDIDESQTY